jgi:arylsulfatase A-like enzyme
MSFLACHDAAPKAPSNVVLVVIDTLRSDHLAHYGYDRQTDLALDGFRDQATLFRQAYSTAPWTSPSVASLLSGLETPRHGTNAHGTRLPDEIETLAEVLVENGYYARGISHNVEVSRTTGFHQGFDDFEDMQGRANDYPNAETMLPPLEQWLESWSQKSPREGTRPAFFLYLQPMNVHGPYRVPESARSTLLGRPRAKSSSIEKG